jgi:hypothetical protein
MGRGLIREAKVRYRAVTPKKKKKKFYDGVSTLT